MGTGPSGLTRDIDGFPVETGTVYLTSGYILAKQIAREAGCPTKILPHAASRCYPPAASTGQVGPLLTIRQHGNRDGRFVDHEQRLRKNREQVTGDMREIVHERLAERFAGRVGLPLFTRLKLARFGQWLTDFCRLPTGFVRILPESV